MESHSEVVDCREQMNIVIFFISTMYEHDFSWFKIQYFDNSDLSVPERLLFLFHLTGKVFGLELVSGWSVGFAAHGHGLVWVRFHGEAVFARGDGVGQSPAVGQSPRWQSRSVTLTGCSRRGRLSGGGLSESRILRSWWESPGQWGSPHDTSRLPHKQARCQLETCDK